jgi:alkylation response protein AidB-like acyl-CoA dehydrogenase
MDLEPDDAQSALRDELRRFLSDRVTSDARRACASEPGAVDRALWAELAALGAFTVAVPEARGGVGLGWADAVLVFEELGRAAVPGPLVGTTLAATLVPGPAPDPGARPPAGLADPGGAPGQPTRVGGDAVPVVGVVDAVDGPALVEHLAGLDALVVLDRDGLRVLDGPDLASLVAGATPLDRPVDPLTPVARVARLDGGRRVGDRAAADAWLRAGALLTAALQVGLGEAAVVLGTDYARQRHQFGRAIGSFQAVKHMLADAYAGVEVARSAVWSAAVQLDEALAEAGTAAGAPGHADAYADVARAVAGARIVASGASVAAAKACIQVHGGMGFTWELDAHLYLKRALALDTSFGSVDAAVTAMAAAL